MCVCVVVVLFYVITRSKIVVELVIVLVVLSSSVGNANGGSLIWYILSGCRQSQECQEYLRGQRGLITV